MSDTSGLNLNNINVDESGRVSFSGLRSGIDIEGTVDAIIQARRIPVDRLETRVADNQEKLTALDELESVVNVLRDRLSVLRGAVSFNNANNIFAAKNAFASASRIDSGSASPVAEIMGISVDNSAALGVEHHRGAANRQGPQARQRRFLEQNERPADRDRAPPAPSPETFRSTW